MSLFKLQSLSMGLGKGLAVTTNQSSCWVMTSELNLHPSSQGVTVSFRQFLYLVNCKEFSCLPMTYNKPQLRVYESVLALPLGQAIRQKSTYTGF